jgi:hypothetical protein
VAFAVDSTQFENPLRLDIGQSAEKAARVLRFLCPDAGFAGRVQKYTLKREALIALLSITGPFFRPDDLGGSGWLGSNDRGEGARIVNSLIYSLRTDTSPLAMEALLHFQNDAAFAAWRADIICVAEEQARLRRELAFKYLSILQVIETLHEGRPANVADLQALVYQSLDAHRDEMEHGSTDGWKLMWNLDSRGRPTAPCSENDCRDRLLTHLRPRLQTVGVAAEREGDYAMHTRADIKAIIGTFNLPIEIKRHYNRDLWSAPTAQLQQLYAHDPGTGGRGIYLVLWFGLDAGAVPRPPDGVVSPQTASELQAALLQIIPPTNRETIEILVINCSPR